MTVADRIQCYLEQEYAVLAVLGGNEQSPGCAIHETRNDSGRLADKSGIFMKALSAELARRGLRIPLRGMRDADPKLLADDLVWLRRHL